MAILLASCDNCAHRKESACSLGQEPQPGEFLCPRYAMTEAFRNSVLAVARREFERDVNQAMLEISVLRAEQEKSFAG
jgi:putative ribosome biogenesis GTPase RsgA